MEKESTIFFVWNPNGGQWKKKHETCEAAQFEAERLAKEQPGQRFYVLAAIGVAFVEAYPKVFTELTVRVSPPF